MFYTFLPESALPATLILEENLNSIAQQTGAICIIENLNGARAVQVTGDALSVGEAFDELSKLEETFIENNNGNNNN